VSIATSFVASRSFVASSRWQACSCSVSLPRLDTNLERLYQIPGQPPSLLNPPSGCRFHPRCAFAMPICRQQDPRLMAVGSDTLHEQACHLDEATKAREAAKLVAMFTAGASSS